MTDDKHLNRWRLVLGEDASPELGDADELTARRSAALDWLYGRGAPAEGHRGGRGPSQLSVPEWINEVHELFPEPVIERIEHDAVERYGIEELVTNPDVLDRVQPSEALLQAVLRTKHLMDADALDKARRLVAAVVKRLLEELQTQMRRSVTGPRDRRRPSPVANARNFDFKRTLRQNLKHYDHENGRLVIERPAFHSRVTLHTRKWQVILLVDQSGSMLESTMHAAICAACLWGIRGLRTHLCVFDTEVVDLTDHVTDPVEVLMGVQLGGGTFIHRAVEYAAQLIDNPERAIVVVITDLYEGGPAGALIQAVRALCQQRTQVLILGVLSSSNQLRIDEEMGARLSLEGARVGVMTPMELVGFVTEALRT